MIAIIFLGFVGCAALASLVLAEAGLTPYRRLISVTSWIRALALFGLVLSGIAALMHDVLAIDWSAMLAQASWWSLVKWSGGVALLFWIACGVAAALDKRLTDKIGGLG